LAPGDITAEALGDVEADNRVLVLRRIHVVYTIRSGAADREKIERVHAAHASSCPVARSFEGAIAITTAIEFTD
jgi:uncharacterized OsmC-like protein